MRDAVIVEAVRTPVGRRNGALKDIHPVDLSAVVLTALAERTGLDVAAVDDVVWGCVGQVGEQSANIARSAVLAAGWPEHVPGTTVDRQCGSSQQAIHFAAASVIAGHADVVVAGGVESMSRVPMGSARKAGPGVPFGPAVFRRYDNVDFNQAQVPKSWRSGSTSAVRDSTSTASNHTVAQGRPSTTADSSNRSPRSGCPTAPPSRSTRASGGTPPSAHSAPSHPPSRPTAASPQVTLPRFPTVPPHCWSPRATEHDNLA